MKTSPISRCLVLLAMLSAAALADPAPRPSARQLVPQLRSLTYPAGDAQVNGLVNAYTALGEELMKQLERDPLTEDQQSYGYYLLGALRVNEAAWLLVERIDFQAKSFDSKISLGRWNSHPAREALVKLGRSADREILAKAQRPQSESRLEQMASVLKAHYGKRQALEEVHETIGRAETGEARANLGRLHGSLQGLAE